MSTSRRKEIVKEIRKVRIKKAFYTFLIDKWNGISIEESLNQGFTTTLPSFYNNFNIPTIQVDNKPKYYNPIIDSYDRSQSLDVFHQAREYGCYYGIEDKKDCKKVETCAQDNCNRGKGNIWVKDGEDSYYRLSNNYISVIKNEILHNQKIEIDLFVAFFYEDVSQRDKFIEEFNITLEELEEFFDLSGNNRLKVMENEYSLNFEIDNEKGIEILKFLKFKMRIL